MPLVKMGRAKLLPTWRAARKVLGSVGGEIMVVGRRVLVGANHQFGNVALFVQWRRMPKSWELSFVSQMKSAEAQGIPFAEVLRTSLPKVMGDAPSEVLHRWVGEKARSQPKRFAKTVAKMFGPSGKRIITGLEEIFNPQDLLQDRKEPEEPFQALIDVIERADERLNPPRYLDKNRWKNFSA